MIPTSHPLASVNGVYNAIYVVGDAVGETMFFGEGAGSLPAASAVVGDVIEAARSHRERLPRASSAARATRSCPSATSPTLTSRYYVRLEVADRPGVLAAVAGVFGDHGVSIASVIQKRCEGQTAEIVYVTHDANEAAVRDALAEISDLDVTERVATVIRVEDL